MQLGVHGFSSRSLEINNGHGSGISVVVIVLKQFFGVVGVGAGLSSVEVCWWDPFGVPAGVFAGGPALFGEVMVGAMPFPMFDDKLKSLEK